MRQGCLVPNIAEVTLVCLRPKDGAIEMQLRARRSISTCPACGTASRRVHSHYQRKLADLPWEGLPVVILLQARKFFCVGDSCRRKIFTEPLPGTVARYARRSCRSSEALHWLTLALGVCRLTRSAMAKKVRLKVTLGGLEIVVPQGRHPEEGFAFLQRTVCSTVEVLRPEAFEPQASGDGIQGEDPELGQDREKPQHDPPAARLGRRSHGLEENLPEFFS
jgi:transposase IS204/IS1001/IS1096/IS1165 family protein